MSKNTYNEKYMSDNDGRKIPQVVIDSYLVDGQLIKWKGKMADVHSPIYKQNNPNEKIKIGSYPMMDEESCLSVLNGAVKAFDNGQGLWPTLGPEKRIEHVVKFLNELKKKKTEIVDLLMWEICKNYSSSVKEFDRTISYVEDTIKELKKMENGDSRILSEEGTLAQIRRAPLGVVLCCGPFNYPFNELYCTLFPALLMGNCIIMKLPRTGALLHAPTIQLFKDCFPPGVVNIISGSGRETMPPIMKTGKIDVFAFIGTSSAADAVQKAHPQPHRLRICLGLEAKNPAIILEDADMDITVKQCILGSLSFNGQRCTAIKVIYVHESREKEFLEKFSAAVDALKMGVPWEDGVEITPLPEVEKPDYLKKLIDDALSKGASIANSRSGVDRTFVAPTVLKNVTKDMKIYSEEQFGPVVPVLTFKDLKEIYDHLAHSNYGQQASVFSSGTNKDMLGKLIDVLVNQVSRVNLNSQCQRGPDKFPFTGRKDSAYGTLSVYDALRVFSIRSFVATLETPKNTDIISGIIKSNSSKFLRMDHIF